MAFSFDARGRARHLLVASIAIGAAIAACSDFGSTPTDDAPADGGAESATIADTGGFPDAPSPQADGGQEASTGWVPCDKRTPDSAHFCDDFDIQSGDVTQRWSGGLAINGSYGQSQGALSPPKAFQAHTNKTSPLGSRAQLYEDKDPQLDVSTKTSVVLSFWMKTEGNPFSTGTENTRFAHVAVIEFDDAICATSGKGKTRSVELSFTSNSNLAPNFRMATKGFRDLCLTDAGGPT